MNKFLVIGSLVGVMAQVSWGDSLNRGNVWVSYGPALTMEERMQKTIRDNEAFLKAPRTGKSVEVQAARARAQEQIRNSQVTLSAMPKSKGRYLAIGTKAAYLKAYSR